MNSLTLKQLRYFEALATHGHFGRAADASAISQPALSVQIRDLEADLGVALFERSQRQVRLTAFGQVFAERVRPILRAVDELVDVSRAFGDRLSGRLRLGVIPTIAPYLLPSLIRRLAISHPDVDLHIRETMTAELTEEITAGSLDCALLALPVPASSLDEAELFTEEFLLARPGDFREGPAVSPETLREMRLLLLEEGHCFRDQALSFCHAQSVLPKEMMDGGSLSTLVQIVGAGFGATLIPEMAAMVETRATNVTLARFTSPRPQRTIGLVWRKSSPLAARFREIADVARDCADDLPHWSETPGA